VAIHGRKEVHVRSKLLAVAGVVFLALVIGACSNDDSAPSGPDQPRTIEITALDELAFEPSSIRVEEGETVTFVVTNAGDQMHEFVVGDTEMQETAEQQMSEGMGDHMEAMASLTVEPGETAETTIRFDEPGELLFACHVEGHYVGGMVGTIAVS